MRNTVFPARSVQCGMEHDQPKSLFDTSSSVPRLQQATDWLPLTSPLKFCYSSYCSYIRWQVPGRGTLQVVLLGHDLKNTCFPSPIIAVNYEGGRLLSIIFKKILLKCHWQKHTNTCTQNTKEHTNYDFFFGLFTLSKPCEMHSWHCGRNCDAIQSVTFSDAQCTQIVHGTSLLSSDTATHTDRNMANRSSLTKTLMRYSNFLIDSCVCGCHMWHFLMLFIDKSTGSGIRNCMRARDRKQFYYKSWH